MNCRLNQVRKSGQGSLILERRNLLAPEVDI